MTATIVIAVAAAVVVAWTRAGSDAAAPGSPSPLRDTVMEHEEAIAGCMAARGFQYVATLPADVLLEEARAAAEAEGRDLETALTEVEIPEDPNKSIVAALPPARAEAYANAYWGDDDSSGCYYETYEHIWGVDILSFGAALDARLPDVERQIAEDERIIAAKAAFVACMAEQGFAFDDVDDIRTHRSRETTAVLARMGVGDLTREDTRHPDWVAHEAAMDVFDTALAGCEPTYDETIRPIENDYLTGMANDIRRARR